VSGAKLLRWAARGGSLVTLAFVLAFVVGGRESMALTARETIGFLLFPGGILAGQLFAWRYELAGALMALASLAAFYGWCLLMSGKLPGGPYFALLTLPAVLFLAAWFQGRRTAGMGQFPSGC
jgi:hypothetical protein